MSWTIGYSLQYMLSQSTNRSKPINYESHRLIHAKLVNGPTISLSAYSYSPCSTRKPNIS